MPWTVSFWCLTDRPWSFMTKISKRLHNRNDQFEQLNEIDYSIRWIYSFVRKLIMTLCMTGMLCTRKKALKYRS